MYCFLNFLGLFPDKRSEMVNVDGVKGFRYLLDAAQLCRFLSIWRLVKEALDGGSDVSSHVAFYAWEPVRFPEFCQGLVHGKVPTVIVAQLYHPPTCLARSDPQKFFHRVIALKLLGQLSVVQLVFALSATVFFKGCCFRSSLSFRAMFLGSFLTFVARICRPLTTSISSEGA